MAYSIKNLIDRSLSDKLLDEQAVKTLYERLKDLPDKRKRRGVRYPLATLLTMVIVAKLSGEGGVRAIAEWIKYRADCFQAALDLKQGRTLIAVLNNLVIGLIRQLPFDFIPAARRFLAANFQAALRLIC